MIPKEILKAYEECSERMGLHSSEFPFSEIPDDFGGYHLELLDDGKMALVGTDRGVETKRLETYSIDELMYWIFLAYANSKAFYTKGAKRSYEESQKVALEEMGKVSRAWQERLRKDQLMFRSGR